MGKNQEVYDAELHAIYRAMLTLFQEPRGQKITIFADAQAALQRITSDAPGPGQRYALAIAQQAHDLWEQRRVSVQFRWVPSHAGTAGNEKTDEWAKMAARNERGSEQLPYESSSTSLAHLKRGIAERKWVEACSWMESRLSMHRAYRPRKRMRPDPTPAKASKAVASRFTSSGRGTPSSGRTSRRSASAPATPVGGATAELSSLASICSRAARSGNPNRPSCGQRSGRRPRSGKGRSRYPSSLLKKVQPSCAGLPEKHGCRQDRT